MPALLLGGLALSLLLLRSQALDVAELVAGLEPQPGAASPSEIVKGALGERYLLPSELRRLHLKIDLENVSYLKGLQADRWGLACARGIDCIPEIVEPKFETVLQADKWLGDGDLVLSVYGNGILKAYPLRVMAWHQVLNDYLGDTPVVVIYSPFTGAGVAFIRPGLQGEPLEFRVSGRLYNADVLLYDRQTGTLWQGFTGEPLAGPLVGLFGPLQQLPSVIVPWGEWKRAHPGGQVLARPERIAIRGRRYRAKPQRYEDFPYAEYELRRWVGYGVDVDKLKLQGLPPKRRVTGLAIGGEALAFLVSSLGTSEGLLELTLGGEPLAVLRAPDGGLRAFRRRLPSGELHLERHSDELVDVESGRRWDLDGRPLDGGPPLERLPTTPCYWFAWVLFHPETDLFPLSW